MDVVIRVADHHPPAPPEITARRDPGPVQQIPHHRPPLIIRKHPVTRIIAQAALPHRPGWDFPVRPRWWVGQPDTPGDRGIGQSRNQSR
jgi:hypothetical protein